MLVISMAHYLVFVLIPDLVASIVDQVWARIEQHCGDAAEEGMRFAYATIGGRWNGLFRPFAVPVVDEVDHLGGQVRDNVCVFSNVPIGCVPSYIVVPGGEMHCLGAHFLPDMLGGRDSLVASGLDPSARKMIDENHSSLWIELRRIYARCYAVVVDGKC